MKSKELKVYNLPSNNQVRMRIDAKPVGLFFMLVLIGIITLMFDVSYVYGISLIVVPMACYIFMPSVVLIEFYDEYLVLHNKADKDTCILIYYEDVEGWYYVWAPTNDKLVIELSDGSTEKLQAFSKPLFEAYMNRMLKAKHKKKQ